MASDKQTLGIDGTTVLAEIGRLRSEVQDMSRDIRLEISNLRDNIEVRYQQTSENINSVEQKLSELDIRLTKTETVNKLITRGLAAMGVTGVSGAGIFKYFDIF